MTTLEDVYTPEMIERLAKLSLRHNSPPPADPLKLELWATDLFNREMFLINEALEAIDDKSI